MKVLLLSRPVVNAGDFLFTEKAIESFGKICSDSVIENGHLTDEFSKEYLNEFDSVVLAGGPLYDDRFLNSDNTPVLGKVADVKAHFYILSGGWYGRTNLTDDVYGFSFNPDSLKILKTIEDKGGKLSARDDITARVLMNHSLKSVKMVGCVAWYDFDYMNNSVPKYNGRIKRVAISDQGITKDNSTWEWKFKSLEHAVKAVKNRFPDTDIFFTFNGGIDTKYSGAYNRKVIELLKAESIEYKDISGGTKGFELYDDADLHVGFRVHSHIYCMSRRIPSILISEDARGSGCNESMGLPDIRDYTLENGKLSENRYLGKQLEYYIGNLEENAFEAFTSSYTKMNYVFKRQFAPFIKDICG